MITRNACLLAGVLAAGLLLGACGGKSIGAGELGGIVESGAILAGRDPERAQQYGQAAGALAGAVADVDWETEQALGGGIALHAFDRVGPLHPSDELQRYVNLVGRAVARQSSRPGIPYMFAVIENDAPNAFAGPGGYIFITTGALRQMNDEAELAGVLAHEVAHVAHKHMLQTYRRNRLLEAAQITAQTATKDAKQYGDLVNFGSETLFERGLDQRFEFEADIVGVEIAALTGYDPAGLERFLRSLQRTTTKQGGWFSTHPDMGQRLTRLQALRAELGTGGITNAERFRRQVSQVVN